MKRRWTSRLLAAVTAPGLMLPFLLSALGSGCAVAAEIPPREPELIAAAGPQEEYASEAMRKLAEETAKLADGGKASVPRLLKLLRDTRVVSSTHHPGGRDKCGMPLVGYTTKKTVADVAAATLVRIYAAPGARDADDDTARQAIAAYFREQILNDNAPDYSDPDTGLGSKAFVIRAMGSAGCREALDPLLECLEHFMAKKREWKWIPGREFIGATLEALAAIGDKRAALAVHRHLRKPGCDFLYVDLTKCLSAIGRQALPELLAAVSDGMRARDFSYEQLQCVMVLGTLNDKQAVPVLRGFLDLRYDDEWRERDFKSAAIGALAALSAVDEDDRIAQEYPKARPETQYVIVTSLQQLWKNDTSRALQFMVSGNGNYRTLVAGHILAQRGRREDREALKTHLREGGPEFQAAAYGAIKAIASRLLRQEAEQKTREAWALWGELGRAGKLDSPPAVPVLLHIINRAPYVRLEKATALQLLGRIGAQYALPDDVVGQMVRRLTDEDKFLAFAAAGALGRMGRNDGLAAVTEYLKNPQAGELYLEIAAEKAHADITGMLHPRMQQRALAGEEPFIHGVLELAESNPSLPLRETIEQAAKKSANPGVRKRADAVLPRLVPLRAGPAVRPPLPAVEPWAKEPTELRVVVDALEEGVRDEATAKLLERELEFVDQATQSAIRQQLAKAGATSAPPREK